MGLFGAGRHFGRHPHHLAGFRVKFIRSRIILFHKSIIPISPGSTTFATHGSAATPPPCFSPALPPLRCTPLPLLPTCRRRAFSSLRHRTAMPWLPPKKFSTLPNVYACLPRQISCLPFPGRYPYWPFHSPSLLGFPGHTFAVLAELPLNPTGRRTRQGFLSKKST